MAQPEKKVLPLDGVRVLDLCQRFPGAFTAMMLADFGADVIKVDAPAQLSSQRAMRSSSEKFAAYFALDRNKRAITINLKTEGGLGIFKRLVGTADVLIEGFRPGAMKQLGGDYEALREVNPRLIYCALSGYGQDGPYALLPGHDMNYCAFSGALSLIGPRDGAPCLPSNLLGDFSGGALHGVVGIMLALRAREKTGRGQFVDMSYLDGIIDLLAWEASGYFATGRVPERGKTDLTGGAPWAQVFRCSDGEYFVIGCAESGFWENLCRALGREDLIPFHRATGEKADWVVGELARVFSTRRRDEWFEFLKDKQTCISPVYHMNEAFADPQVIHRGMVAKLSHPTLGEVKQVGIAIKLSDTPGEIRTLGVPPGTHTAQVLGELGYSGEAIEKLKAEGAV